MPLEILDLNGTWKLKDSEHMAETTRFSLSKIDTRDWYLTQVPGDIHPTLEQAGIIPPPFENKNSELCKWTEQRDWWYRKEVEIPQSFENKELYLVFDGIDTYASIFVNGRKIGEASNSFLQYQFDVSPDIRIGEKNTIAVCVHATKTILESRDTSKYFACFYLPRIFARKAQCHFSWDWAPDLPALGIWQGVRLEARKPGIIENIYIRTRRDGNVHFQITTDKSTKELALKNKLKLQVNIETENGMLQKEVQVCGGSNFINLSIESPKLWWPHGYGEPNLYQYTITLMNGDRPLDIKHGRFGIRDVKVIEEGNEDQTHSFRFRVNGIDVFCLGANWVPIDCFPGAAKEQKYRQLLRLANEADINMLRVWGGGIYEQNIFYDLCDELGIMVWQDMMFACSDIPDDDLAWTHELIPEFEYQVKRLRNHPSIVHWCGGNEKTGTYGEMISYGEVITRYLSRGVIGHLMPDVAYTPSSPYSITDVGNDPQSGDTHGGTWEQACTGDISQFRDYIDQRRAGFMSEFGMHGPPQLRTVKKFIGDKYIWPLNGVWEHHVQDNPYNTLKETFIQIQEQCASALFHTAVNAADFVKVAGTFYAEYLYAEFQHHRRRWPHNGGALIWMFNDCWPCASWSVVDYYGYPKQPYYALKRACRPVMPSFRQTDTNLEFYITHNLSQPLNGMVRLELQTVDGTTRKILATKNIKLNAHSSELVLSIESAKIPEIENSFVAAILDFEGQNIIEPFFHKLWKNIAWPQPDISTDIGKLTEENGEYKLVVHLKAKQYARCVNLAIAEDIHVYYSDNYFDMIPGQTKTITIKSPVKFDLNGLEVRHWLTEWN